MEFSLPLDDTIGNKADLLVFSTEATWLVDTEVMVNIEPERGRWNVYLLFVSVDSALTFLRRKIHTLNSYRQARIYANMYQRTARKDERGNLTCSGDDIYICDN